MNEKRTGKNKLKVWDGLYVHNYEYTVKFLNGDSAGQVKTFKFRGHVGNRFEKLSWLVANQNMSMPKYEVLAKSESEPLTENEWDTTVWTGTTVEEPMGQLTDRECLDCGGIVLESETECSCGSRNLAKAEYECQWCGDGRWINAGKCKFCGRGN